MTQQALYPAFPDASRLHSTPFNSDTRSRHDESNPANSTSARRRERERNRVNIPTTSRAQIVVDEARQRREREAARAREAERDRALAGTANPPQPNPAQAEVTSPGTSPALTGPECLSDAIRSESFPSSFKEPRKVPNYEPNMDPTSWLGTYEMAMSIRNATGNLCA